jgi:hypothetical protein
VTAYAYLTEEGRGGEGVEERERERRRGTRRGGGENDMVSWRHVL